MVLYVFPYAFLILSTFTCGALSGRTIVALIPTREAARARAERARMEKKAPNNRVAACQRVTDEMIGVLFDPSSESSVVWPRHAALRQAIHDLLPLNGGRGTDGPGLN
mgnify:CR=1 FL=1